jgi:CRISPR-associated protein Cas5d
MLQRSQPLSVRISGPFALFTRPEMKVERVSYDFITPSAARGVLEAVLWKPGMRWVIQRITVLKPIRFMAVKRNEVGTKIPSDYQRWARENAVDRPYFADDDRQQRNAQVLCDVDYLVEAVIQLAPRAGPDDSVVKFVEMFRRRVEKGQHFQQPYLGCREFPATVAPAVGDEKPDAHLASAETDYGWMLHDVLYKSGRPLRPAFFRAQMRGGVVDVPALEREVAS